MRFDRVVIAAAIGFGLTSMANAVTLPPQAAGSTVSGMLLVHESCHQDVRSHVVGPHRHDQFSCATVAASPFPGGGGDDCHADVRRHFVPGYGSIWHRHFNNCQVDPYPNQGGPTPGVGGCVKIGPATICPGL